ncbi:hypothetical protein Droror1_Dr00019503 [Drosera rotundifolia]
MNEWGGELCGSDGGGGGDGGAEIPLSLLLNLTYVQVAISWQIFMGVTASLVLQNLSWETEFATRRKKSMAHLVYELWLERNNKESRSVEEVAKKIALCHKAGSLPHIDDEWELM